MQRSFSTFRSNSTVLYPPCTICNINSPEKSKVLFFLDSDQWENIMTTFKEIFLTYCRERKLHLNCYFILYEYDYDPDGT